MIYRPVCVIPSDNNFFEMRYFFVIGYFYLMMSAVHMWAYVLENLLNLLGGSGTYRLLKVRPTNQEGN
jgi:hypothetical protein